MKDYICIIKKILEKYFVFYNYSYICLCLNYYFNFWSGMFKDEFLDLFIIGVVVFMSCNVEW